MLRDPRDIYLGGGVTVVGQRVRDRAGHTGLIVDLETRLVRVKMAAVLYDDATLRRYGPILTPLGALTFLTEAGNLPTLAHPTPDFCEAIADD